MWFDVFFVDNSSFKFILLDAKELLIDLDILGSGCFHEVRKCL